MFFALFCVKLCRYQHLEVSEKLSTDAWFPCTAQSDTNNGLEHSFWLKVGVCVDILCLLFRLLNNSVVTLPLTFQVKTYSTNGFNGIKQISTHAHIPYFLKI